MFSSSWVFEIVAIQYFAMHSRIESTLIYQPMIQYQDEEQADASLKVASTYTGCFLINSGGS